MSSSGTLDLHEKWFSPSCSEMYCCSGCAGRGSAGPLAIGRTGGPSALGPDGPDEEDATGSVRSSASLSFFAISTGSLTRTCF